MGALFALGFRPFYLLAGGYAAASIAIWALQYSGVLPGADMHWHAHEMLFGYAFAVIAGFLLTAVRAWSGRPTPTGAALAGLAVAWVCARLLALYSLPLAALADMVFALGVAWGIGKPLVASDNRRNWFFIVLMVAMGAASILFQADPRLGVAAGLDLVLFVMAVVAGRVVPGFTNNAVPGAGARRIAPLERAALGAVLFLFAADMLELPVIAAAAAVVGAALHGWRLALWAPFRTRGLPILWILHLSYGWVVVHLALRGLAGFGLALPSLAAHALTVGAIGGLTLGMMTRTARGHTAHPLSTGHAELLAYMMVQAAAVVRVLVPLVVPGAHAASISLSALLWSAAFAVFTVTYFPILSRPRLDGRPG
ncbi:MAG TPA: NnrS family protein [Burkholderiales bacterium]|nr:NnrS family protein [Burkholderiales bacterium]